MGVTYVGVLVKKTNLRSSLIAQTRIKITLPFVVTNIMIIIQGYYLRLITLFYLLSFGSSKADLESSSTTPNLAAQDYKKNGQSEERQGKEDVGLVAPSKRSIRRKTQLALCNVGCYSNPNCQNSADSCKWCGKYRSRHLPRFSNI
jgi:hypothetical protein